MEGSVIRRPSYMAPLGFWADWKRDCGFRPAFVLALFRWALVFSFRNPLAKLRA